MKPARQLAPFSVAVLCCTAGLLAASAADDSNGDASLSTAVCPIVYRLDEHPSGRGYRYTFYGNAFFVNEQGYMLAAAHVLETFRNGGQPSIAVTRPNSPPQLLPVEVVAMDTQHDVAILRATPNPFGGHHRVTCLTLASEPAFVGQSVLALSLHPARLRDAQSFQSPIEDRSAGQVLSFETTQLEKSDPATEVFLLSHPVTRGQSGSPVMAADSHGVIGLIEGRWLRNSVASLASSKDSSASVPGAAVPIGYAISLLDQKGIAWHAAPRKTNNSESSTAH
jgi:hypothetical protein